MNGLFQLEREGSTAVRIRRANGRLLWRYVFQPETPAQEAPRPFAHPLHSLEGDVLTNFRPNDHPWHHALSLTITSVDGVNFWGGPSYRAGEGYQWREDHGAQIHREWKTCTAGVLEHTLDWFDPRSSRVLLQEHRTLRTSVAGDSWTLRWTSQLHNATGRELTLGNYEASGGLSGSHYTGLQFRGARELLDEHGDVKIGITAEGGRAGEGAVHGAEAAWMEWQCQHDGSLRRTRIRFENLTGPIFWFVRGKNPLAAFSFHRQQVQVLAASASLQFDHLLTFATV